MGDIVSERLRLFDVCLRRLGGDTDSGTVAREWCSLLEAVCCVQRDRRVFAECECDGAHVTGGDIRRQLGGARHDVRDAACDVGCGDSDSTAGVGVVCAVVGSGVGGQATAETVASVEATPRSGGMHRLSGVQVSGFQGVEVDRTAVSAAVKLGPNGGVSFGRGPNYERNQRNRERRRAALDSGSHVPEWRRGARDNCSAAVGSNLRESLEAKWAAENALAKLKAERQAELLRAQDLDEIKRMQRAQVLRTTETCKVQTEKAFASLAKSGNVPDCHMVDGGGRVEGTVLTNSTPGLVRSAGDTISPDSSASMHEFRKCQKDLLDSEARNEKHVRTERRMAQVIERLKGLYPAEDPGVFDYSEPGRGITHYTLDSDGDLPAHVPDCFGYDNGKGQWRLSEPDYDGGNGFPY